MAWQKSVWLSALPVMLDMQRVRYPCPPKDPKGADALLKWYVYSVRWPETVWLQPFEPVSLPCRGTCRWIWKLCLISRDPVCIDLSLSSWISSLPNAIDVWKEYLVLVDPCLSCCLSTLVYLIFLMASIQSAKPNLFIYLSVHLSIALLVPLSILFTCMFVCLVVYLMMIMMRWLVWILDRCF